MPEKIEEFFFSFSIGGNYTDCETCRVSADGVNGCQWCYKQRACVNSVIGCSDPNDFSVTILTPQEACQCSLFDRTGTNQQDCIGCISTSFECSFCYDPQSPNNGICAPTNWYLGAIERTCSQTAESLNNCNSPLTRKQRCEAQVNCGNCLKYDFCQYCTQSRTCTEIGSSSCKIAFATTVDQCSVGGSGGLEIWQQILIYVGVFLGALLIAGIIVAVYRKKKYGQVFCC